jgi:predicted aspartyl protease
MTVPFDRLQHLVRVPVQLGGDDYFFLVDTGIGVTVVSSAIAERADVTPTPEFMTGQRMSGQEIRAPLVRLPRLSVDNHEADGILACVADFGDGFAGIIGPDFYAGRTLVVDSDAMTLTFGDAATAVGYEIPLECKREGYAVSAFATVVLPSGREVTVEVDTGSDSLILDTRFAADCGVDLDGPGVTTKTGTDETGYHWTRRWATVDGSVHLTAAPQTAQGAPQVMFQDIIYDGLIGTDYLNRYRFTIDFDGSRMFLQD